MSDKHPDPLCAHNRENLREHFSEKWPGRPLPPCSCPAPVSNLTTTFPRPWRILDDPSAGLDVVLHPSGFHFLLSPELLAPYPEVVEAIAQAAGSAVLAGTTGQHLCEVTRSQGAVVVAFLPTHP